MKNKKLFCEAAKLLPADIGNRFTGVCDCIPGYVKEIRLYPGMPVIIVTDKGKRFVTDAGGVTSFYSGKAVKTGPEDLRYVISRACDFSLYSFEKELNDGYIPFDDGIRIGIGCYKTRYGFSPENIASVNIRLPFDGTDNLNTCISSLVLCGGVLVAGAPMSGKTTMLKACCRELCDLRSCNFRQVSIVDGGGELGNFSQGEKYYAADVIGGCEKADGIRRALHYMSPEIIVCDEIGSKSETLSILEGMNGGVVFLAAMHCKNIAELVRREQFRILFSEGVFENVIMLSRLNPGVPEKVYCGKEVQYEIRRYNACLHGIDYDGDIFAAEAEKEEKRFCSSV